MGRRFDVLVGLAVIAGTIFTGLTWWGLTPPLGGVKAMLPSSWGLPNWGPLTQAILGLAVLVSTWILIAVRLRWIGSSTKVGSNAPQITGRIFPIESGLYVGHIAVSIDKLNTDLFVEITILGYNGTGKFVSIDGVDGGILYGETRLPAPTLIGEKANIKKIPTAKEFVILLEQRVPRDIVDHILKILAAKQTAKFMLSSLNVRASFPPNLEFSARLPLWDGLTVDQSGRIPFLGRIVLLTALGKI